MMRSQYSGESNTNTGVLTERRSDSLRYVPAGREQGEIVPGKNVATAPVKTNCYAVPRSGMLLLEMNYSSLHIQQNQCRRGCGGWWRGQRTTQEGSTLRDRHLNSLNRMTRYMKSNHVTGCINKPLGYYCTRAGEMLSSS